MAEKHNSTYNDAPTLNCSLGRDQWRNAIRQQIIESQPPKVIAIHGTWGMGKTSALWQLYKELGGEQQPFQLTDEADNNTPNKDAIPETVKSVWFEAWQYQHEPNILAALLKEIRDQLSLPHKIWKEIDETMVVGAMSALESIELTFSNFAGIFGATAGGSKGFASKFKSNMKEYQRERFYTPMDSVQLKKQLQDAITKLLNIRYRFRKKNQEKDKIKKAVIFIDDLDRCEPEVAYRILEAIKVYLNLNNCVFVLGMDINAMDKIIVRQHKDDLEIFEKFEGDEGRRAERIISQVKHHARLYLEKICQDIYFLPVPSSDIREQFFKNLLHDKLTGDTTLVDELMQIVSSYSILPPFPRSVKIYANIIITFLNQDSIKKYASESEEGRKHFLMLTYLYAFHLELYHLCVNFKGFYNAFYDYCQKPTSDNKDGIHPELRHIKVFASTLDSSTQMENAMSGKSEEPSKTDSVSSYPYENLRQVLWIGKLVKDILPGDITFEQLRLLEI